MTLDELGFTKEELQERVIERLCDQIMGGAHLDDTRFRKDMDDRVRKYINETVDALGEKHVLPNVVSLIENMNLQATNSWGEKQGEPVTFIQYLVKRAEAYMQEPVDYQGKTKAQDSYNWSGKQSRMTYLIEKHLQFSIETAMKDSLKIANDSIAKGIEASVKMTMQKIVSGIQVGVSVK